MEEDDEKRGRGSFFFRATAEACKQDEDCRDEISSSRPVSSLRGIYCRRRRSPHCQDLLSQCTSEYMYQISPRAFLCLCTHFISLLLRLIESPPCLFFRYKTTFTDLKPALSSMLCGPVPVSPVSSPGASSPCTHTPRHDFRPCSLAIHPAFVRTTAAKYGRNGGWRKRDSLQYVKVFGWLFSTLYTLWVCPKRSAFQYAAGRG